MNKNGNNENNGIKGYLVISVFEREIFQITCSTYEEALREMRRDLFSQADGYIGDYDDNFVPEDHYQVDEDYGIDEMSGWSNIKGNVDVEIFTIYENDEIK